MPQTRTARNAARAVRRVRNAGGPVKGGGGHDPSEGKIGASSRTRAKFAREIAASGRRERRRKGGARVNV